MSFSSLFPSTISRISRPFVGRQLVSSPSPLLPSCSSRPRCFSSSLRLDYDGDDTFANISREAPAPEASSSTAFSPPRRKPPTSRRPTSEQIEDPPVAPPPRRRSKPDQRLREASFGLLEPITTPTSTSYLLPTSLTPHPLSPPSDLPPPHSPTLSLTPSTLAWFSTFTPITWHRLLTSLDTTAARLDYQRKAKYLTRALKKSSPELRERYLRTATGLIREEDEELQKRGMRWRSRREEVEARRRLGGGVAEGWERIASPEQDSDLDSTSLQPQSPSTPEEITSDLLDAMTPKRFARWFTRQTSRAASPHDWLMMSGEEKTRLKLAERERLVREMPELGGRREALVRRLEEMDRAREERVRE